MSVKQHDNLQVGQESRANVAIWRVPLGVILAGLAIFVISTAVNAIGETFDGSAFPEALAIKLEALPLIFPVHMFTGGMALLLVPVVLLLRGTRWHKWAGRVAALDVSIAGATAVPVALTYPVTPWAAAGFSAQGLLWMTLLGIGIWNIRQGRVRSHQKAMLLLAAVTSGAVFFRIYLALWAIYGSRHYFTTFYSCDAWMAWGLPFLLMLAFTRGRTLSPA